FKEINVRRKVHFVAMILAMLVLLAVAMKPSLVLFLFFLGYSLSGYEMFGYTWWKQRQ
ncbi:CDP-diacylglycerol--serine O-phosphatidyltransferase, partial [Neisseria arctica]